MKERPILFSGPMVRAILDGRKTQTRRVIKPQLPDDAQIAHLNDAKTCLVPELIDRVSWFVPEGGDLWPCDRKDAIRAKYLPGDLLWVRETHSWITLAENEYDGRENQRRNQDGYPVHMLYKADDNTLDVPWRPSIHMPKWACRLWLEVTGVRVERVQDISASDCWNEGITYRGPGDHLAQSFAIEDFQELWNTINTTRGYSWESNPWVWVVEFAPTPSARPLVRGTR